MPTRREQIKLEGRERDKAAEKEGADKDVELGRRAMSVISNVRGGSVIGDGAENPFGEFDLNQDFGGGFDEAPAGGEEYGGGFDGGEFQLDLDLDAGIADEQGDVFKTPTKANRASKKQKTSHDVGSREPSIFEGEGTPAPSSLFKDDLPQYRSEGPLAVFDDVSSASTVAGSVAESQSQSQPQAATASQSLGTTEEGDAAESMVEQKTGTVSLRSKNTRKAVGVLKSELLEKENETGVETLEFGKVAEKVRLLFLSPPLSSSSPPSPSFPPRACHPRSWSRVLTFTLRETGLPPRRRLVLLRAPRPLVCRRRQAPSTDRVRRDRGQGDGEASGDGCLTSFPSSLLFFHPSLLRYDTPTHPLVLLFTSTSLSVFASCRACSCG